MRTTNPERRINLKRIVMAILSGVIAVAALVHNSSAQDCESPSEESAIVSIGANEEVVYHSPGSVRLIAGRVLDRSGAALSNAIVDVFPLKKSLRRSLARPGLREGDPVRSFKTNESGEFCLGGLRDGLYELRFGTDQFAFKHAIIRVRKTRSGATKPIEVTLEAGT